MPVVMDVADRAVARAGTKVRREAIVPGAAIVPGVVPTVRWAVRAGWSRVRPADPIVPPAAAPTAIATRIEVGAAARDLREGQEPFRGEARPAVGLAADLAPDRAADLAVGRAAAVRAVVVDRAAAVRAVVVDRAAAVRAVVVDRAADLAVDRAADLAVRVGINRAAVAAGAPAP